MLRMSIGFCLVAGEPAGYSVTSEQWKLVDKEGWVASSTAIYGSGGEVAFVSPMFVVLVK